MTKKQEAIIAQVLINAKVRHGLTDSQFKNIVLDLAIELGQLTTTFDAGRFRMFAGVPRE